MRAFEIYTAYDFLWFFAIYACLGWGAEVAFAAVCDGKFVNRGFLNGPICPIYGFGVVIVIATLMPLMANKLVLFVGSVLITSVLEWITGFVLEKVFRDKWWDYSDMPFNVSGYICLKFSLLWGLACVFIMTIFHPTIVQLVNWVPPVAGWIILSVFLILFAVDTGVTAGSILKLNKKLEQMEEIAEKLRETSEHLGESISDNVLEFMEKSEEWKEKGEELKEKGEELREDMKAELSAQTEELRRKYNELINSRKFIHHRILKAFPGMKSRYHMDAFEELKKRYGLK